MGCPGSDTRSSSLTGSSSPYPGFSMGCPGWDASFTSPTGSFIIYPGYSMGCPGSDTRSSSLTGSSSPYPGFSMGCPGWGARPAAIGPHRLSDPVQASHQRRGSHHLRANPGTAAANIPSGPTKPSASRHHPIPDVGPWQYRLRHSIPSASWRSGRQPRSADRHPGIGECPAGAR